MPAPGGVKFDKNVLGLVAYDAVEGVGDEDLDGSVVLLRRFLRLVLGRDLSLLEVGDEVPEGFVVETVFHVHRVFRFFALQTSHVHVFAGLTETHGLK